MSPGVWVSNWVADGVLYGDGAGCGEESPRLREETKSSPSRCPIGLSPLLCHLERGRKGTALKRPSLLAPRGRLSLSPSVTGVNVSDRGAALAPFPPEARSLPGCCPPGFGCRYIDTLTTPKLTASPWTSSSNSGRTRPAPAPRLPWEVQEAPQRRQGPAELWPVPCLPQARFSALGPCPPVSGHPESCLGQRLGVALGSSLFHTLHLTSPADC